MKKFKQALVLLTSVLLACSLSACNSLEDISGVLDQITPDTAKDGKDYIEYVNKDRLTVIEPYIGDQVGSNEADVLLDNVEFFYYEQDAETKEYEVGAENKNGSYYFDGTILLKSDDHEYKMNIYMLPPDSEVYFYLPVEGEVTDYEYFVEGDFYRVKEELESPAEFTYYETDAPNEFVVVLEVDEISEKILEEFAEYEYITDTLYNIEAAKYYLVTADAFDEDESAYDYELEVDASSKSAKAKDVDGKSVLEKTY
jgi:hypothetical protein